MSFYCPNCGTTIPWGMIHTYTEMSRLCMKCKEPVNIDLQIQQVQGTIKELVLRAGRLRFSDKKENEEWIKYWIIFDLITHLNFDYNKTSDFLKSIKFKPNNTKDIIDILDKICDESGLYSFDEMRSRLTIETLPFETQGINLHYWIFNGSAMKSLWLKKSKEVRDNANGHCELCSVETAVQCHEVWQFSEYNHIQRLVGFLALCMKCHLIKHNIQEPEFISWKEAILHIAKVNGWSYNQAEKYKGYQRWIQSLRYHKGEGKWRVDFTYAENMLIENAKTLEKTDPDQAIIEYKKVIQVFNKINVLCREGKAVRNIPYPINRLTLLLERQRRYEECLKEIEDYFKFIHGKKQPDLSKIEEMNLQKRKFRMIKKLKKISE